MAISSEIEKLERRWQENPAGLMFAPLAEAYRKAGNYQRALEVLEVGLAVHADYVPALIVRGRCHLDAADLAASETAFHQALASDPANPIALRSMADLYERSGRLDEAIERLTLLVEVDRGDGEARASLERLRGRPTSFAAPAPFLPDALSLGATREALLPWERAVRARHLRHAAVTRLVLGMARRPALRRTAVSLLGRAPRLFDALVAGAVG